MPMIGSYSPRALCHRIQQSCTRTTIWIRKMDETVKASFTMAAVYFTLKAVGLIAAPFVPLLALPIWVVTVGHTMKYVSKSADKVGMSFLQWYLRPSPSSPVSSTSPPPSPVMPKVNASS